jgi:hypothetical protein
MVGQASCMQDDGTVSNAEEALRTERPQCRGAGRLLKEVEMLLHLPIAILTTLAPIPVSDAVPKLDIAKECRFEGGSIANVDRCSRDETAALQQLKAEWPQFSNPDKRSCFAEATASGFASYVELIICLEMARDVGSDTTKSPRPPRTQSTPPAQPEMSVVDKRD